MNYRIKLRRRTGSARRNTDLKREILYKGVAAEQVKVDRRG